ncbi:MAG: VWA domain-containing protein [Planctomycetota bacterium]
MNDEHADHTAPLPTGGTPSDASERELFAARITAHALGQLDAAEAAEIERVLADPARSDARQQVAEIRRLAAGIRSAEDENGLARSPELRRAVLAAAAAARPAATASNAADSVRPAPRQWTWPVLAAVGSLAAALVVAATLFIGRPADRMVAMNETVKRQAAEHPVAADGVRPAPNGPEGADRAAMVAPVAERAEEARFRESKARKIAGDQSLKESMAESAANGSDAMAKRDAAAPSRVPDRPSEAFRLELSARRVERELAPASNAAADKAAVNINRIVASEIPQSGEGYAAVSENRSASSREQPLSTFSIDVDTASYANVRRFLSAGRMPPRDAVRIEELVNYFRYDYPRPDGDKPFSVTVEAAECPWNAGRRLVRIGLQGRDIDRGARPAGNLVFLVDVSGSMNAPNKLPLVKQALAMLVEELSENDRVAIVTYAGNAGLVLPPTTGDQKGKIRAAIDALTPGGSTHGSAGINLAYEQAQEHFVAGGSNRVILATDGDLNVGVTSNQSLVGLIKQKAAGGTFLTVLGFGEGNLQDDKMEAIADNGNGIYAYIDGVREARKVLVEQLTGSTVTIAKDVKIQVEFNPAQVASYRLLGYENRLLAARDFRDDKKDAGEIGAGHSVTAVYEITLVGAETGAGAEPLKYQRQEAEPAAAVDPNASSELLTVKLRSKRPDGDTSVLEEVPLADRGGAFERASADLRFASAVAAFGMILRSSEEKGDATLPLVAKIAAGALGPDNGGYRAEFLDLVRKAESAK